jgi:hypothetical protein
LASGFVGWSITRNGSIRSPDFGVSSFKDEALAVANGKSLHGCAV